MARKNILKSGKWSTSALVCARAHLLKFTDELPGHAREPYKKAVCSLEPFYELPPSGPFAKEFKRRIDHPRTAVYFAFEWIKTDQGVDFWFGVCNALYH